MMKKVFDMNPFCVTVRPLDRTPLGEENLKALLSIGVDHIDFSPNPKGVLKLMRRGFEEYGDLSLGEHLALYTVIPNLALRLRIPLVVWGENAYMEYGGNKEKRFMNEHNRDYVSGHDILKGRMTEDWVDENLSLKEIQSMIYLMKKF